MTPTRVHFEPNSWRSWRILESKQKTLLPKHKQIYVIKTTWKCTRSLTSLGREVRNCKVTTAAVDRRLVNDFNTAWTGQVKRWCTCMHVQVLTNEQIVKWSHFASVEVAVLHIHKLQLKTRQAHNIAVLSTCEGQWYWVPMRTTHGEVNVWPAQRGAQNPF